MRNALPGTRRLLITWAVLMGLTLVSMLSAQLGGEARLQALPLWSALLLLLSTGFKAHQVLMVYLNLRTSTAAWKGTFIGLAVVTLAVIGSGYVMARFAG
ncbi:cytochrome C oxidase subunit IV family protein [Thioalkalivibrio thiocyanodenitrificans]|uniref:cytochrome C oxidase subunit IV family protein n=1 Tax=Thioalkalivibrio thiocyanodenitrificans TaxID=243063 RepID=UPI0003A4752B|nr:cytochrome C oxidase subunit IV family protein [Thioalkalivibrio thiocyanodenitrificans]